MDKKFMITAGLGIIAIVIGIFGNGTIYNIQDSDVVQDVQDSNVVQDVQDSNVAQGIVNSQVYQNVTTNYNYYGSDFPKEEIEKQQKEFEEKIGSKNKQLGDMLAKLLNAYFDLLEIHDEDDNYEKIIHYANEILFYQSNNTIALDTLGVALARAGFLEQSIKNYTKLLTIMPDDYSALANNAWSLTKLEQYDDALILLNKIESMSETDPAMLANKCWILHKTNDHPEALSYCKRALDQNEDDERALGAYSLSLSFSDRSAEALPYYKKLHELRPDDLPTIINYANALSNAGQINNALTLIEQGLDKFPNQQYLIHNKKVICVENPQLQCPDS
ncbi:MAG: tetratricopeptide repeat protein [Thaumarchaeota archaeon]|nr:tetratricopeptide repeat protein [Nitrososphaerota archaeon]